MSLDDLVIYELHVGTFTPAGTFDGVIERLGELAELGVTAIEIMPISQFPGRRNWGYDGVHPYAAQNTYGGPRGFQRLVDAAHRHGLAVVLDVVYNHFGPEGNYLADFGPYFTDRYHTPWGAAVNFDGRDCEPVRRLVIDNALMWVRDFHVDALRLDAVQTIYDLGARHILQELQEEVQREAARQGRRVLVIAETDQNDPRLVTPVELGGYGLDGVWSDDFHHAVHAWLTGQRDGYYPAFGDAEQIAQAYNRVFVRDGRWDPYRRRRHGGPAGDLPRRKFVVCVQNHDQVGNRVHGDRLSTYRVARSAAAGGRFAAAVALRALVVHGRGVWRAAALPLLLFLRRCAAARGGAARPPPRIRAPGISVEGQSPRIPTRRKRFKPRSCRGVGTRGRRKPGCGGCIRTLLSARRTWPALAAESPTHASLASWPDSADGACVLELQRGQDAELVVWANLTGEPVDCPTELPAGKSLWLSTAAQRYGGPRSSAEWWCAWRLTSCWSWGRRAS